MVANITFTFLCVGVGAGSVVYLRAGGFTFLPLVSIWLAGSLTGKKPLHENASCSTEPGSHHTARSAWTGPPTGTCPGRRRRRRPPNAGSEWEPLQRSGLLIKRCEETVGTCGLTNHSFRQRSENFAFCSAITTNVL